MSSNFLCFQLFYTEWWHLAPGKFFPKNPNSFQRYWGPNFDPFLGEKWNCYFESEYMCQEQCWSISFFIFWKYGLNYTRKSNFWPSYACCCVEIMTWNHENLNFCQTLDFMSPMAITCTYFFLVFVKAIWGY